MNNFWTTSKNTKARSKVLIKLLQQYSEPWHEDEQLKQLYKTYMNQIKDQGIYGRQTSNWPFPNSILKLRPRLISHQRASNKGVKIMNRWF